METPAQTGAGRGCAAKRQPSRCRSAFRANKRRRITPSPEPCRLSVSAKGRLPFETHRVQNPYRVKAIVVQCCPRPFPPCGFHLGSYRFVKRILILCNRISKPFHESRQKPTKPPATLSLFSCPRRAVTQGLLKAGWSCVLSMAFVREKKTAERLGLSRCKRAAIMLFITCPFSCP